MTGPAARCPLTAALTEPAFLDDDNGANHACLMGMQCPVSGQALTKVEATIGARRAKPLQQVRLECPLPCGTQWWVNSADGEVSHAGRELEVDWPELDVMPQEDDGAPIPFPPPPPAPPAPLEPPPVPDLLTFPQVPPDVLETIMRPWVDELNTPMLVFADVPEWVPAPCAHCRRMIGDADMVYVRAALPGEEDGDIPVYCSKACLDDSQQTTWKPFDLDAAIAEQQANTAAREAFLNEYQHNDGLTIAEVGREPFTVRSTPDRDSGTCPVCKAHISITDRVWFNPGGIICCSEPCARRYDTDHKAGMAVLVGPGPEVTTLHFDTPEEAEGYLFGELDELEAGQQVQGANTTPAGQRHGGGESLMEWAKEQHRIERERDQDA